MNAVEICRLTGGSVGVRGVSVACGVGILCHVMGRRCGDKRKGLGREE